MTLEQKKDFLKLRQEGFSFGYIANRYSVSRQCIQQSLKYESERKANKNYIYPIIADWLISTQITACVLAEKLELSPTGLHNKMTGKNEFTKREIDKLLELTKMTYETVFKTS